MDSAGIFLPEPALWPRICKALCEMQTRRQAVRASASSTAVALSRRVRCLSHSAIELTLVSSSRPI